MGFNAVARWWLLFFVAILPNLVMAGTARQEAMQDVQCGAMPWEECKAHLAQMDAEGLYRRTELLYPRYRGQWEEVEDISAFLHRTAADKGHFRAQVDLARHYLYVRKDAGAAAQWYEIAAANERGDSWERRTAAERAVNLRALPGEAIRDYAWFLAGAALLLAPVFLPWGVRRNNRKWEIVSAVPNLFNGIVYMVLGEELKHPLLLRMLTSIPDEYWLFGAPTACAALLGVALWRNQGRRIYIVTNAVLYATTIGTAVLILMAIGGMASPGAGR